MAFLEYFSEEDRATIISLPYRVGLWVSTVDETGGHQAEEREMETLRKVIDTKMTGMFPSAFVHEVMTEIVSHSYEWQAWAKNKDTALEDCPRVLRLLKENLLERDVDAYRANLMLIGAEVAAAFREFDLKEPPMSRLWAKVRLFIDKCIGTVRGEVYESERLLNISYEEDLALSQLIAAVKGADGAKENAAL